MPVTHETKYQQPFDMRDFRNPFLAAQIISLISQTLNNYFIRNCGSETGGLGDRHTRVSCSVNGFSGAVQPPMTHFPSSPTAFSGSGGFDSTGI